MLFCGGKSVGHLAPLVAIWREMHTIDSKVTCLFLCTDAPSDAAFLAREDVEFVILRKMPARTLTIFWVPLAMIRCFLILKARRPNVIVSKGGIVSIPLVLCARMMSIPVLLHESDTVSGRATRFLAHFSNVLCRGLPWDREKEPNIWRHAVFTGNPVRRNLSLGSAERGREITGLTGEKPVLLVMGGSQGALRLNEIVLGELPAILKIFDVIHLTGRGKETSENHPGYFSLEFANDELPHLYAITNIALSRAGAGAVSELALFGIPTILVPLEGLAQNHQLKNAEALAKLGACLVIRQEKLKKELLPALEKLLKNASEREHLSAHMRQISSPDAAKNIAEMALALVKRM